MEYEDGFYHVNFKLTGERTIAGRDNGEWWVIGCEESFDESDFSVIGPKIEIPVKE